MNASVVVHRRKVAPFDDVEVDVDVQEVLEDFHGVAPEGLDEMNTWIVADAIHLEVASPKHFFSTELRKHLRKETASHDYGGGTAAHRALCAIAAHFLLATGFDARKIIIGGTSSCSYSGGWADVCLDDGSLFIECGTLRHDKLFRAMQEGETVMVLPYRFGCKMVSNAETRLSFEDGVEELAVPAGANPEFIRQLRGAHDLARVGSIQLAYTFKPLAVPRRDLFKNNATEGLFE